MSPAERRASVSLAAIFGLRMFGMFIILPVFALYAERLPGGASHTLIGVALGAYGLTQALLQIPFGWLSDRYGRKTVIYGGLVLFAIGSFVAASAHTLYMVIVGRVIQGAGAISGAVIALAADLTREEHRTQAMALIGITIGITFSASMVAGPPLDHWIGVPGIFMLTGVLALLAIGVVYALVPNPPHSRFHSDSEANPAALAKVLKNPQLLRLNYGIFALHSGLMAMFVVVPFALRADGLASNQHWQIYLPVMLIGFGLMVPPIIYGEKKAKLKQVFTVAVALLLVAQLMLGELMRSLWGIAVSLLVFFTAFNVLEAILPSLISKIAPAGVKGTASGVYSSVQFAGTFAGAAVGGWLSQHFGAPAVFAFCTAVSALWLLLVATMQAPPAVRTRMYALPDTDGARAQRLSHELAQLPGVREAVVSAEEGAAYLKVDMAGFDEQRVLQLIQGRT
ncbi:MAG TPA: MFS transporter [Burkholderiales bacterium]|nr:MFS transporter [Burkholderiales bacterium]